MRKRYAQALDLSPGFSDCNDRRSHALKGVKSKKKDGIDKHKFEYNIKI